MNTKNPISPPRWADRFLQFYCHEQYLEEIQGDAHELFELRHRTMGPARARRLFVWDVLRFLKWSNIKRVKRSNQNSIDMLRNYIKISWRGLVRDRLYSLINLSGLTVAVTVFLLIFLYVREEVSYDRYHPDYENTYRVVSNLTTPGNYFEFAITPPHLGARMQEDFPEVLDQVRLSGFTPTLHYKEQSFEETESLYADAAFFDFFGVNLLKGDRESALKEPYSVLLSESAVERYFGREEPMGKLMQADGMEQPLVVTGIIENVPVNTHFEAEVIVSMSTKKALGIIRPGQWFFLDYYTYFKVKEAGDIANINDKMPAFIEKHIGEAQRSANQTYEFEFQRLKDIHLNSNRDVELAINGNLQYIIIFSVVAVFILLIACVNFMNLSTARAARRSKEIGVRKVVGAVRKQLITQFLVESILISLISFVMAFGLTWSLIPAFNTLVGKQLFITSLLSDTLPYFWFGLILLIGLLAGIYPALFLSRFRAVSMLKSSKVVGSGNPLLRKGLVVFQLMISTMLVVGVIVINQQLNSMQNKNLGFDKESLVLVDFNGEPQMAERLRAEMARNAAVQQLSFSRFTPREGAFNWFTEYEEAPGQLKNASMFGALVDYEFIETYQLNLVAGRSFDRSMAMDADSAFVLNEAAVKKMGYASNEAALGQLVGQNGNMGRVIGVVSNFNFESLHKEIEPLLIYISNPRFYSTVSLRLETTDAFQVLSELEKTWEQVNPDEPFEAAFLDDRLDQMYQAEALTQKVFGLFSQLAIFIAALGLFALSTFTANQQQKAISVRKVLGASVSQIVRSFVLQFVKLSLLAFAVSAPIAWILANSWLKNFTYRIDLNAGMLLLTAAMMLLITVLAVSFQSFRISRANPTTVLRSE